MQKNVVINSQTYNGVDKVRLKDTSNNNVDFVETTDANATASDIANNKTAYVNGVKIIGTHNDKTLGTKNITSNGTYNASSDNVDGYSQVVVNVEGGGITPTGTKTITSNGTYDVTNFASAEVNVSGGGETEPSLPSGYTRYLSLISTGTQYIDTNIAFDGDWVIEPIFVGNNTGDYTNLLGIDKTFLQTKDAHGVAIAKWGDVVLFNTNAASFGSGCSFSKNGVSIKNADRVIYLSSATGGIVDDLTLAIMARHKPNGVYDLPFKGKVYSIKISKNNTVEHWFLPAMRNSDSTLGMFDTITETFYTNDGAGTFTGEELQV